MPSIDEIRRFSESWRKFSAELNRDQQNAVFARFRPNANPKWFRDADEQDRHRQFFVLLYNPAISDEVLLAVDRAVREATSPWNAQERRGPRRRGRKKSQ